MTNNVVQAKSSSSAVGLPCRCCAHVREETWTRGQVLETRFLLFSDCDTGSGLGDVSHVETDDEGLAQRYTQYTADGVFDFLFPCPMGHGNSHQEF